MANVTAKDARKSVGWGAQPTVAQFTIDFDSATFTDSTGKKIPYTSGDVVRLTDAIPTGAAMCVLAVSTFQNVASTAATSAVLDIGFDGGETLVADYNMKSAANTKTNTALAAPVFGAAGTYLTCDNTVTGAGLNGKVTISVVYCLV